MSRIELTDTGKDMLLKLAEGNPDAATALMAILRDGTVIDPQAWSGNGGLAAIISLDEYGIYGGRIWCLYKDVCNEDSLKCIAVLRAVQCGIITREQLNRAVDNRGAGLCLSNIMAEVKSTLSEFGKAWPQ